MKRKILVIFLLLIPLSYFIYKITFNETKDILVFGDNYLLTGENKSYLGNLDRDKYNINTFTYDYITYKEMLKKIKSNDYIIIKNKEVYLNQLISKAEYIIINANNKEYFNKCKKNDNIIKNYNTFINNDITNLYNLINKISNAKIIVIGNYCKIDKNEDVRFKITNSNIEFIDLFNTFNKLKNDKIQEKIFNNLTSIIDKK